MIQTVASARLRLVAASAAVVLLATACGGSGSEDSGAQPESGSEESEGDESEAEESAAGVPPDASDEEYAAALEDEEPVELRLGGLPEGEGDPTTETDREWTDRVEELSGGYFSFDFDYGMARVPLNESAAAMNDGRQDLGMHVPSYEPDRWPVHTALNNTFLWGNFDPIVGKLVSVGVFTEMGFEFDALREEFRNHGLFALYPMWNPDYQAATYCTSDQDFASPDALSGLQTRVAAGHIGEVVGAMGMTPVSMNTSELFEAIERGVVDCATNPINSTVFRLGLDTNSEVMGYGTDSVDLPLNAVAFSFSLDKWEALPLAARQVIFDTQAHRLETRYRGAFESRRQAVASMEENGVEFRQFGDETIEAIEQHREDKRPELIENLEAAGFDDGEAVLDRYIELVEKWEGIVVDDLGYEEVDWEDFTSTFSEGMPELDLEPFAQRVYEEVLVDQRPTE